MKLKKNLMFRLMTIIILTSIIIVIFLLYNKTYNININPDHVYEIQTQLSGPYHVDTITDQEEINTYLETVQKLQFTHPHIFTGKGWSTLVTIKLKNDDGIKTEYRYSLLDNYISTGSFRYKIISR